MRFSGWKAGIAAAGLAGSLAASAALAAWGASPGAKIAAGKGVLGLVVAARGGIREIVIAGPGGERLRAERIGSGQHVLLFAVVPGRYCFDSARVGGSDISLRSYGGNVCFWTIAGVIGYAGHYGFSPGTTQPVTRYDEPGDFRSRLQALRPGLARRYPIVDLLELQAARLRSRGIGGAAGFTFRKGRELREDSFRRSRVRVGG